MLRLRLSGARQGSTLDFDPNGAVIEFERESIAGTLSGPTEKVDRGQLVFKSGAFGTSAAAQATCRELTAVNFRPPVSRFGPLRIGLPFNCCETDQNRA